ncbi:TetR/AcrR family transcriptional regulator [Euzebya tangerina]|uniref:TetR/AcrR family transcriptional regulator n=1 Tax=Euzebya tangerina TaxID=591198 RepID=UPI000E311324|nr:TetR/AcrR family transcriptional regulator [Euzebya tangerina]
MPTSADVQPEGRRARLRREAIEQIKTAALDQVRTKGAADVSLRAIAREAGMSPAGLYRYFDGRDALLTALIADSFDRLAATITAATDRKETQDHSARLLAAMRAYREWGVSHPHEFGLVFGNPIPGYAAPPDGATVVAMSGVSVALFTPLLTLWAEGRVAIPSSFEDTRWAEPIAGLADEIAGLMGGMEVPARVAGMMLAVWGRLHGIVSLEVFGQLDWVYPDGSGQLFEAEMAALLSTVLR